MGTEFVMLVVGDFGVVEGEDVDTFFEVVDIGLEGLVGGVHHFARAAPLLMDVEEHELLVFRADDLEEVLLVLDGVDDRLGLGRHAKGENKII